jgi:hypothetical protein
MFALFIFGKVEAWSEKQLAACFLVARGVRGREGVQVVFDFCKANFSMWTDSTDVDGFVDAFEAKWKEQVFKTGKVSASTHQQHLHAGLSGMNFVATLKEEGNRCLLFAENGIAGTSSQGSGPNVDSLLGPFTCPMPRCLKECQQRYFGAPRCPADCKKGVGHPGHCDCLQEHIPPPPRSLHPVTIKYDWSASGLLDVLDFSGHNDEFTCVPCGPPQELNWPELCICRAGGIDSCLFPTGGRSLYCSQCGSNVYCACGCGSCDPSTSYSETDAASKITGPKSANARSSSHFVAAS